MNKQGLFGLETVKAVIIVFIFLVVIAVTLILVSFQLKETGITSNDITLTPSDTFLSDNGTSNTLTYTPSTWTNATTLNNSWLSFDGVNDYVSFSGISDPRYNFTMSLWFNHSSNSAQDYLFRDGSGRYFIETNNNKLFFRVNNQTGSYYVDTSNTYNDSVWHNLIITNVQENNNYSIYIDGVFINNSLIVASYSTVGSSTFGYSANSFDGQLDEVRFYNRPLSENEVLQTYSSGRTPNSSLPTTGLVLWLPLNENSGADIHSLNQSDF